MCVGNINISKIPFKVEKNYTKILGINIGTKAKEARATGQEY